MKEILAIGSAFFESQMLDSCRIYRNKFGWQDEVLDPVTGTLVGPEPPYDTIYEGKCRIAPMRPQQDLEAEIGGHRIAARHYKVQIPLNSTNDIRYGDQVLVLTAEVDKMLIGRVMRVVDPMVRTHSTYRRINVMDTTDAQPEAIDDH
jgi:hypothetical protein